MKAPPTITIPAEVLSNFPTITGLITLTIEVMPNQKPIMIRGKILATQ
jgi:hypothetical protein